MSSDYKVGEPIELDVVYPCVENERDNVFVCWSSPEERCKGSLLKMDDGYNAERIFILKYSDHHSDKRAANFKDMQDKLRGRGRVEELILDEDKPLPILKEFVEQIETSVRDNPTPRITIDISTVIKWHLLVFLKFLELRNLLLSVRIIYTEPEDYFTDLFQSLSFGIKEIFPIPTFYGDYDFSKGDLLVLMLGYEGSRAMALYEEIDPTECLLLVPDPPYRDEWRGRTEEMNKEIINIVGQSKIKHIHSRNPQKVALQLREVLSSEAYAGYNHIISPLGTKPQTVGLYSYLSTGPVNTILIYGAPLRHNEFFYSSGIGRTWQLPY